MTRTRNYFNGFLTMATIFSLLAALSLIITGCSAGHGNLMATGHNYLKNGQYEEALKCFRKAANQNSPYGYYRVGYMYEKGLGVKKDPEKALEWYKKGAAQGFCIAESQLAGLYERGDDGVPQDFTKARQWYLRAIEHGCNYDMFKLGQMYEYGRGVERNKDIAYDWYLNAANKGIDDAKKAVRRMNADKRTNMSEKAIVHDTKIPRQNERSNKWSIETQKSSGNMMSPREKATSPEKGEIPDDLGEL